MSQYRIPTLTLACRLIKLVSASPQGLTRDEIEKSLEIPRSSAYRMLQTLLHEGFIEHRNRLYFPGNVFYQMGLQVGAMDRLRPRLRPIVHSLAEATGFTAHLAVPSGYQAMLAEVCDSQNLVRVASRPGTVVPLHVSATGKVFLSYLFAHDLESIEQTVGFARYTDSSLTTLEEVEACIQQVLTKGYAVDERELNESVRCLAAPIHDRSGSLVAAIGVTAPVTQFMRKNIPNIAQIVKSHARRCYAVLRGEE